MSEQNLASGAKTPPRAENHKVQAFKDTPRVKSLATRAAFQSGGTLETRRDAVMEFTEDVPIVSLEFFHGSVLEWSILETRLNLLRDVERELVKGGHLANGSWVQYSRNPSRMTGNEDVVFLPLAAIFKAIISATHKVKPHKAPQGERRNATRPDTSGVLVDPEYLHSILTDFHNSWFTIALVSELKKELSLDTALDNVRKTFWSAGHMLANDPARRFVFAFTIEDTSISLWFMSRSQIMASEKFNFISTPQELIRAVATFAFASPEKLGFDTTVSQFRDDLGRVQYKICLKGETYFTIRPLTDYRADAIRGRATRVWLVHPEGEPDVFYVLKDVWVPEDSVTEGDQLRLLHEVLASVESSSTPDTRHPSEYFLTVVDDGFVSTLDETEDNTLSIMGGKTIPVDAPLVPRTTEQKVVKPNAASGSHKMASSKHGRTETLRYENSGLAPSPPPGAVTPGKRKQYEHRTHYRIIFKEVGISIYDLESIPQVMKALADAIEGLKVLHRLGLVHRDISPGNILVVDGVAKITDLEYTKVYRNELAVGELGEKLTRQSAEPREDKTGTAAFLAVEVSVNAYSFVPAERLNQTTGTMEPILRRKGDELSFFRYNPLHDLESTFWIALWIFTCKMVDGALSASQREVILAARED
ncbi:hypothetical protein C8F04DRAFT_1397182 [Mycena alexandri]|uniref:Protein kinase domain-containing protein n=1 Tax=Mycena alexandri TaxID=1745969 RepID=A0AAD6X4B5_9AGAR|nr:hypothetical protein C8F04DRAFT_1397182 [Mycena alexandri]